MEKRILFSLGALLLGLLMFGCSVLPQTVSQVQATTVIDSPPSNSEFHAGENVAVQSTSTDPSGIARVELAVDGNVVHIDTPPQTQTAFSVIQMWQATEGTHTISVRAFNSSNQSTQSAQVTVMVVPGAAPSETVAATPAVGGTPNAAPTLSSGATPIPAPTLAPTAIPAAACNVATFVADVTIPDGTPLAPGQPFSKTWRLRNRGTCAWTSGYTFSFVRGDPMGAVTVIGVPDTAPGATVDLTVPMTAPGAPGLFSGFWQMRNPAGVGFGSTVWVRVNVPGIAPAPVFPPPPPAPAPPVGCSGVPNIASFSISPSSITSGQSATLSWGFVSNADAAIVDNGIGGVATPGSTTVTPGTTTTYTIIAYCRGTTASAQVTINVSPAPAPVTCSGTPSIQSFTVSPSTISPGQSATLSWGLVGNATSASINNGVGGVTTPGQTVVSPGGTTTYILTANCGISTATAQVTLQVAAGGGATATPRPTRTPRPSATPQPTVTPRPTRTPQPTATPRPTRTRTPTRTPTP